MPQRRVLMEMITRAALINLSQIICFCSTGIIGFIEDNHTNVFNYLNERTIRRNEGERKYSKDLKPTKDDRKVMFSQTSVCLSIGGTPVPVGEGTPVPDEGIPPPPAGIGYPPRDRRANTCYATGGIPLAVTQEDFLVY